MGPEKNFLERKANHEDNNDWETPQDGAVNPGQRSGRVRSQDAHLVSSRQPLDESSQTQP